MSQPFHKTIITVIKQCDPSPSRSPILTLLTLINKTDIPADHDEILAAINDYFNFPGSNKWAKEFREVKTHLLEQKKLAEKRSASPSGVIRSIVEEIITLMQEGKENRKVALIRRRFRQLDLRWSRLGA